jgi:hypothetical protein
LQRFGPLPERLPVARELRLGAGEEEREGEAGGVGELPRPHQRRLGPCAGLVGMAEEEQGPR